ncbi:hypothetical protein L3X38_006213 [Prunus dulcis]|uniref:ARM repeat superfamily protein n=1 Tax=Prunus dulcis TaxID=3755 RepID=A0AAD4ZS96_PRUDU|nr:hypothetical protein L3X38_006213 [Prunus dulcis]
MEVISAETTNPETEGQDPSFLQPISKALTPNPSFRTVLTRVSGSGGGGAADATPQQYTPTDTEEIKSSSLGDVNVYRDVVAQSGAIEEITGLLNRPSLSPEVKEQAISALWNLSVDEKFRLKIANSDVLPLLVKSMDDEDIKLKEAAGGVLANLALSHFNHSIMVEAGVIPKLAKLLRTDIEGSKEAGAVKPLVQHLDSKNDAVILAVTQALEKLSVSNGVCQIIEAEGVIDPLINVLKQPKIPEILMEKTLDILARILDPSKEMKSKFYDGPVNGSKEGSAAPITADAAHKCVSKTNSRESVLDFGVIAHLVEILKTPTPRLQRKAASILEFCTVIDPRMETIISVDVESGLDVVFQQKILEDMESEVVNQQPEKYALEVEEAGLAISAASRFRDADPRDLEEQKNAKFDMSMMNFPSKFEGPVEKKLRETGEWITNKTERGFRLSGKKILNLSFLNSLSHSIKSFAFLFSSPKHRSHRERDLKRETRSESQVSAFF